jgi:hypothetical protein
MAADDELARLMRVALVAPRTRVLYVPTTKAACTTITMMVAQAEGSYRPELADRVVTNHLSPHQTIHAASVTGVRRLAQLPRAQVRNILTSPDWLRITSVRNPLSRVYSAWENRFLLRAPGFARRLADTAPDAITNGRLDLTATFNNFVSAFAANTAGFMRDHHFMTQTHFIRRDLVDYNHVVRVDAPGALADLAKLLSARSDAGVSIEPQRLNEGLGIALPLVCDTSRADILIHTYQRDFDELEYSPHETRSKLSANVTPYLLSETETRLLRQLRGAIQRSLDITDATRLRRGVGFRMLRTFYAMVHKVSRRRIAMPQHYM